MDAVDFHTEIAESFSASYGYDRNRQERVVVWRGFLDKYCQAPKLAYDLGCGPGFLTLDLAKRAERVVAIDGASGMLAVARQRVDQEDLTNVAFEEHRLPFPIEKDRPRAEFVASSSVIEYLDALEPALTFVRDLMTVGGVVVFSLSNKSSLSRAIVRLVHSVTGRPKYFGHVKHFVTPDQIKAVLNGAGLTYLEHQYFGGADRLNTLFSMFLPKQLSTNMIIFAARRDR